MTPSVLRGSVVITVCTTLIAVGVINSECVAAYDFQFTTGDYAIEIAYWLPAVFETEIENTGTEPDTIDLELAKYLPPGWFADICINGKCYTDRAKVVLNPGGTEQILVDIYVGGEQDIGLVTMTGTMRHDSTKVRSETYAAFAQLPTIMIVDDDAGVSYESYLEAAVDSAGYKARIWNADSLGRPGPIQLGSYWAVLWTTANGDASYLTSTDEQDTMTYLDGGGNLLLASMNFLSSRGGATTFTTDYLHVASWANDTGGSVMSGVPGDSISDGMTLSLVGGPFPADDTDSMVLSAGADSIFFSTGGVNGLKVEEGGHRIVFLSFPFEDVSVGDPDPNNQTTLISRVLEWFDPPQAGVDDMIATPEGKIALRQNFPNPFNGTTRISFAVPKGSAHIDLVICNVNGQAIRTLVSGSVPIGENSVTWDGKDDAGAKVASGLYFYRLSVDGSSVLRKMVLLR